MDELDQQAVWAAHEEADEAMSGARLSDDLDVLLLRALAPGLEIRDGKRDVSEHVVVGIL